MVAYLFVVLPLSCQDIASLVSRVRCCIMILFLIVGCCYSSSSWCISNPTRIFLSAAFLAGTNTMDHRTHVASCTRSMRSSSPADDDVVERSMIGSTTTTTMTHQQEDGVISRCNNTKMIVVFGRPGKRRVEPILAAAAAAVSIARRNTCSSVLVLFRTRTITNKLRINEHAGLMFTSDANLS